jgi:SAM-dependent methyltransferase
MGLADVLSCPACQGRLAPATDGYHCADCQRPVATAGGIAILDEDGPGLYTGDPNWNAAAWSDILTRVRAAAGTRWPHALGALLELGCGPGQMTTALLASAHVQSLTAIDSNSALVAACRDRLASMGLTSEQPPVFAVATGRSATIRDASADTVIGMTLLPRAGDDKLILRTVHRALRPGGRAFFVLPNRRYWQALCSALADAIAQYPALDGQQPDINFEALALIARTRRLIIHRHDHAFLQTLQERQYGDSERMEDTAREIGFATAEALPLDPDPSGGESIRRALQAVGTDDATVRALVPLAASASHRYLELLSRQDSSASMLLWLTKADGPASAYFSAQPPPPPVPYLDPQSGVTSARPRWSLELLARPTETGIHLSLGGWCLAATDVRWVRVTLADTTLNASVWRPRQDVHAVMNQQGLYPPLNAICSGIEAEMVFEGLQPQDDRVPLRFDIVLANDLIVAGPAPDALVMNEPLVIAH